MKNIKKATAALLSLMLLAGCGPSINVDPGNQGGNEGSTPSGDQTASELVYEAGTVLRMATGYNSAKTGLFFDAETAGNGITLADGNTYNTGDLKPTWQQVEKELNVKFEDKYQGNSAAKEFEYWKERLSEVDMVSGTASLLTENGEAGCQPDRSSVHHRQHRHRRILLQPVFRRCQRYRAYAADAC